MRQCDKSNMARKIILAAEQADILSAVAVAEAETAVSDGHEILFVGAEAREEMEKETSET